MTSTETINGRGVLRDEIHLAWDDPWGSCLSNLGALCDILYMEGGEIPDGVEYTPGVLGPDLNSYPASMFLEMLEGKRVGTINLESVEYWIRVLNRYADLVPEDLRY